MSDNSPTDSGVDQSSSDSREESLLDKDNGQSAEGRQDSASGGETSDAGQGEPQGGSTRSSDDDGLAKFAKSQGFDPDNLTEGERRALKLAHDNQKAFRQTKQETNELHKSVEEVHDPSNLPKEDDEYMDAIQKQNAHIRRLEAQSRVTQFYLRNPEAKDYDKEMGELVLDEKKKYGDAAASYLSADLERLLVLAKARRGSQDTEAAREAGAREERELLRQKTEASADTGAAQQPSRGSSKKVTREWLNTEYDPTNPDHQKMVDAAFARGDLY